jgi:hypothetical protein
LCVSEQRHEVKVSYLIKLIFLLSFVVVFQASITSFAQDFPDVCQQSENILRNCTFDQGLEGWQTFLEAGAANFSTLQGGGECHAPLCPAAYIVSEDHFIGGLYQQVPVTKGNNYYANIVWLVFDSLVNDASAHQATGGIGRRIGIDPFGGTDSKSSNVVWSTDNWRNDCKICNIEHVTVTAQADTITVFLRIDDTWKLRARDKGFPLPPSKDQFWIDDIGLKQVGGEAVSAQAPADTPPPTETPAPTETPVPELPTNTPPPVEDTPTPEAEPTDETEQAEQVAEVAAPAETPTVANTSTSTPAPPPTLTPTPVKSPTPTETRRPRSAPTLTLASQQRFTVAAESNSSELPVMMGAVGFSICIGGTALVMVGVFMGGLVWLYRLGWGQKAEVTDEDDLDDDEGT